MRNEIQSKTCDEKPRFAPDRQNCDTEIWIVGDVWKPQHSWKKMTIARCVSPAAGKTNSMQTFSFCELIGERSFLFKIWRKLCQMQQPEGNAQGLRIDLSGYCSKQLGAKKSPKVGHAALPSNLKPKLDQTAFWWKLDTDGGAHLSDVKAKNLPEENWTLCHKGVEAPCSGSRVLFCIWFWSLTECWWRLMFQTRSWQSHRA